MNTATLSSWTLASLIASASALGAPAVDGSEDRITRSTEGFVRDHAADELRDPRTLVQSITQSMDVVTKPRGGGPRGPTIASARFGDTYVYDASTDLFSDADHDGYFHYLRVQFDADTIFDVSYIYAMIYVSADGNSWERVFTTADFAVHGASPDDDYEVETDLVSGYSTGLYDVLIELYDADTDVLVDEYGPNESPEFSVLPLEDSYRDGDPPPPEPIIVEDGGGGAVSWLTLPALLAAAALVRRRRTAISQ